MSKKHYVALAEALKSNRPVAAESTAHRQWLTDAIAIAETLASLNPNFESAKFLRAAGVPA